MRDFEYELDSTLLEIELIGINLEQIAVAAIVVGCFQRAPFAGMCSF